jgi:N-acetylmuramoyl-L-alanine amidase
MKAAVSMSKDLRPSALTRFRIGFVVLFLGLVVLPLDADDSVALKYTYRPDQSEVGLLKDKSGKSYLPLTEAAKFYGVQMVFDPQTRRVTLSKGDNQAKLVVSHPDFMMANPTESVPMDPVEVVAGQLAVSPMSAQDLFSALLGIQVRYLPDQQVLMAGGVKAAEIKNEIMAEEQKEENPPSQPATRAVVVQQSQHTTTVPSEDAREEKASTDKDAKEVRDTRRNNEPPPSSKQIYRLRRIVIDAGHGGKDIGAKGYDRRYNEKQATLAIATKVVLLLKKQPDLEVLMTRNADYFVTLKGRTTFANKRGADLFVSIHCNSNPRSNARGTETYVYSSKASNSYAAQYARLENGGKDYTDFILNDLHHRGYKDRSFFLATKVTELLRSRLGQHIRRIQQAPFYVLARVDMPSILIETAFISNQKEEAKLKDPLWQDKIAKAIVDGILGYRDTVEGGLGTETARR